jgi:hypothetical protein
MEIFLRCAANPLTALYYYFLARIAIYLNSGKKFSLYYKFVVFPWHKIVIFFRKIIFGKVNFLAIFLCRKRPGDWRSDKESAEPSSSFPFSPSSTRPPGSLLYAASM